MTEGIAGPYDLVGRLRSTSMRSCRLGAILIASSWLAHEPAVAKNAIDCVALKTSTMPFELQMRQDDAGTYPVQVYRGENITRLQYTKAGDHLVISRFQANFHLQVQDLAGVDVRFTYNVPTDRYIWQQDSRVVTYHASISGAAAGPPSTQVYEMLPDDIIALDGCSFEVKHFRFKQHSSEKASDEEVWFSSDLRTNLRSVEIRTSSNGATTTRKRDVVAIATEFAPFQ